MQRLHDVVPRRSTHLQAGWLAGALKLAAWLRTGALTRALLITDGLTNDGITDATRLALQAAVLRERGSPFGVGDDFEERLLRDIAHEGGAATSTSSRRRGRSRTG